MGLFTRPWWSSARVLGVTACIAGLGLVVWPDQYSNPSYRVLFHYATARQAGVAWLVVGIVSIVATSRLSICLLGAALIFWGLGFGMAALSAPDSVPSTAGAATGRSGSPLGWVWFIGFGVAVLRTLLTSGPSRMRS